ncbi:MAG: hypothetical protein ABUL60_29500 [Myxococcales bacterium]
MVLSARVSARARDSVQALARHWGTTPSRVLGSVITMLANNDLAPPTRDQLAALKAICAALEIPADSGAQTIKSAVAALIEAAAPPEPSPDTDPLAATPDPPPAQLSRTFTTSRGVVTLSASEIESCKEAGAKLEAYAENKALRDAARRPARAAKDPLRAVQAARREQARRR